MSIARALVGKAVRLEEAVSLANEVGYPVRITVFDGTGERTLENAADEDALKRFLVPSPKSALAYVVKAAARQPHGPQYRN